MNAMINKLKLEAKSEDDICLSDMYLEALFELLFADKVLIEKINSLYEKNAQCRIINIENLKFQFS